MATSIATHRADSNRSFFLDLVAGFRFFGLQPYQTKTISSGGQKDKADGSGSGRPDSGGYNEAFVFQQWATYDPHR